MRSRRRSTCPTTRCAQRRRGFCGRAPPSASPEERGTRRSPSAHRSPGGSNRVTGPRRRSTSGYRISSCPSTCRTRPTSGAGSGSESTQRGRPPRRAPQIWKPSDCRSTPNWRWITSICADWMPSACCSTIRWRPSSARSISRRTASPAGSPHRRTSRSRRPSSRLRARRPSISEHGAHRSSTRLPRSPERRRRRCRCPRRRSRARRRRSRWGCPRICSSADRTSPRPNGASPRPALRPGSRKRRSFRGCS